MKIQYAIGLALLLAPSMGRGQFLGETNVDVVGALAFPTWGTNHYAIPAWWNNPNWNWGNGVSNVDGGSVSNWAVIRAFDADLLYLQRLTINGQSNLWRIVTNAPAGMATNTPDGVPIPRLHGANSWTGTNDFPAGYLTVGGVPVGTGGGTGSQTSWTGEEYAAGFSLIGLDQVYANAYYGSYGGANFPDGLTLGSGGSTLNYDGSVNLLGGLFTVDSAGNVLGTSFTGAGTGLTGVPSSAIVGLPDAQTNSLLLSARVVAWATNSISMAAGVTNSGVWVTNLAGVDFTATLGTPQLLYAFDGIHFQTGNPALITNAPVMVAFYAGTAIPTGSMNPTPVPMPGAMTNITIWRLVRPDLFGVTNATFGEVVLAGDPQQPAQVATKNYVDKTFAGTAWWSAQNDVQLNEHVLNFNVGWSEFVSGSQGQTLHTAFLGQDAFTVAYPPYTQPTNVLTATVDGTGTNVVVSLPTNGVSAGVRLMISHYITPLNWQITSIQPVLSGGAWVFTMPFPWPDSGFMISCLPSANPGVMSLSTMLALPPRTIASATATTWGYGPGLVCVDSNYVYVAVATNGWKRAALSAW
jgi:hypothetical protein